MSAVCCVAFTIFLPSCSIGIARSCLPYSSIRLYQFQVNHVSIEGLSAELVFINLTLIHGIVAFPDVTIVRVHGSISSIAFSQFLPIHLLTVNIEDGITLMSTPAYTCFAKCSMMRHLLLSTNKQHDRPARNTFLFTIRKSIFM